MNVRLNVIILEDETIISLQLKKLLLSKFNFNIELCGSFGEAKKHCERKKFDILLGDINLGKKIDGIETAKFLQDKYKIHIIFLTSYTDDETLKRVKNIDYFSFLIKPFTRVEIETTFKLLIQKFYSNKSKEYSLGDEYRYCSHTQKLFEKNSEIYLTKNEQKLLELLALSKNKLTYETIDNTIFNGEYVSDEKRRQLLFRLRKKVPKLTIKSLKGEGYSLK